MTTNSIIIKTFYCEECQYFAKSNALLSQHNETKKHLKKVTPSVLPELDPNCKHQCLVCRVIYQTHSGLSKHKKKCGVVSEAKKDTLTSITHTNEEQMTLIQNELKRLNERFTNSDGSACRSNVCQNTNQDCEWKKQFDTMTASLELLKGQFSSLLLIESKNKKVAKQPEKTPSVQVHDTIVPEEHSKNAVHQHIYLIREREFINSNENTYKIGRSGNICGRVKNYPKDSEMIALFLCKNNVIMEKKILSLFRNNYKEMKKYGSEYFNGDVVKMHEDICSLVHNESNLNK